MILFLMVYFRKSIIRSFFQGEMTGISLINEVYAQEEVIDKKKILEASIRLEKVSFSPSVGPDGFKVISSFVIDEISCSDLNNVVYQLAVVLHPPEVVNEKFLIKMRDCVLKLPEEHPVKHWLKWMSQSLPLGKEDQESQKFLTEIINSQFNLITDIKIKTRLINILHEIPETTLVEKILKSYLYLMIGNIARSDNILRSVIKTTPRENWSLSGVQGGFYHKLGSNFIPQLFKKLSRHPADRRTFELLCLYLLNFYNDPVLLTAAGEVDTSKVTSALRLAYTETLAPSLVHYLRLMNSSDTRRMNELRDTSKFPLAEQSYWFWAFMDIAPLVSEKMNNELLRIEKSDELWFIYLMSDEKLADNFSKRHGKSFLPGRRPYLKSLLSGSENFMMALYKLIELGDINQELVNQTTEFVTHE